MAEPFVTLTDFAIALQTLLFVLWLWPLGKVEQIWALAFGTVGIAAFAGGIYHGWGNSLTFAQQILLWQTMVIALSIASFWLLVALVWPLPHSWRLGLLTVASVKLGLFLTLGTVPWPFAPRVADYLITLLLVPGVWRYQRHDLTSWRWITVGVIISYLAAFTLICFPSNQLWVNPLVSYHLIQMAGLFCMFWGVRLNTSHVGCCCRN